jgi:hypothetical protein
MALSRLPIRAGDWGAAAGRALGRLLTTATTYQKRPQMPKATGMPVRAALAKFLRSNYTLFGQPVA